MIKAGIYSTARAACYQVVGVDAACTLSSLASDHGIAYQSAFYKLGNTKETVSKFKKIVLIDSSGVVFDDDSDTRRKLGLNVDTDAHINASVSSAYDVFVISTSTTRRLQAASQAMFQVAGGKQDPKADVASSTSAKRAAESPNDDDDDAPPAKKPALASIFSMATTAKKPTNSTLTNAASATSVGSGGSGGGSGGATPGATTGPAGIITPKGWYWHHSLLCWQTAAVPSASKIAAFDYDGCLAKTSLFKHGPDAWSVLYPTCKPYLQKLHSQGFKLVIFTNQSAIGRAKKTKQKSVSEKIARLGGFVEEMGLPFQVVAATGKDECRKPGIGMWDYFVQHLNAGVQPDKASSFFVGDAAGRKKDHGDGDKGFAKNVGITFYTEVDFFKDNRHRL